MVCEDCLRRIKLPTLSYLSGDMIAKYKIITGVYNTNVAMGLFNLKISNMTRVEWFKIFKVPEDDLLNIVLHKCFIIIQREAQT